MKREEIIRNTKKSLIKAIKTATGSTIAILLAMILRLSYETSAGIIALLSILNTKKETIRVLVERIETFIIALCIASACFLIGGYQPISFGLFLFLYAAVCNFFHFSNSLSINAVLITHFYVQQSMGIEWIWNETLLLLVGGGTGLLLNLSVLRGNKTIKQEQETIDGEIKWILKKMGDVLGRKNINVLLEKEDSRQKHSNWEEVEESLQELLLMLFEAQKRAEENAENTLFTDSSYFAEYMNMRKTQCHVLMRILKELTLFYEIPAQAGSVSDFFYAMSEHFHEKNNAEGLLKKLYHIQRKMREEALPNSRREFENRSILYVLLFELEDFLQIKKEFAQNMKPEWVERYWNDLK